MLAGLRCTADPARQGFLRAIGAAVASAVASTGLISQVCIRQAILGNFSELLVQLAGAIGEGAPEAGVEAAARRALSVGHTSGGDGVLVLMTTCGASGVRVTVFPTVSVMVRLSR